MKIGYCTCDISQIELLYTLGYDFVEVNNTYLNDLSEDEFAPFESFASTHPDFIYSCNCMFPSSLHLTGPEVDYVRIREFCESSFSRLDRIGVKMLVFGSSGAKQVPDGFSFDAAMEQLVACTRIFSEIANRYGMRICIEPLRRCECNIINTAYDAERLARLTDRQNVGSHVDFFHMMQNGEKLSCLSELAKSIIHTHIASPVERSIPTFDDGADYAFFFDVLRSGGYDATVSFEGRGSGNPDTLKSMLSYLKSL